MHQVIRVSTKKCCFVGFNFVIVFEIELYACSCSHGKFLCQFPSAFYACVILSMLLPSQKYYSV